MAIVFALKYYSGSNFSLQTGQHCYFELFNHLDFFTLLSRLSHEVKMPEDGKFSLKH